VGWGAGLFVLIALLSVAASARQGPLHAVTTELVDADGRGSYVALRNAASQLGIAIITAASAFAFNRGGLAAVSWIVAAATILIPVACLWIREPGPAGEG
jgi:sugar phosphate permease